MSPDRDGDSAVNSPTAEPDHWRREHYIPLRKADLIQLLVNDPSLRDDERKAFSDFCRLLEAIVHFEFHERLTSLKKVYANVDPDRTTHRLNETSGEVSEQQTRELFSMFGDVLERANYQELSRDAVISAMGVASHWGVRLHVDFDVFRHLAVYGRGDIVMKRQRPRFFGLWERDEIDVPIYQRLVIIFELQDHERLDKGTDTSCTYVRLFKNIPKADMDMLLPGTRVRMTLLDQGKILLPTISGLGFTIFKLVKAVLVLAFAGVYGLLGVLGLVGGTIGYGVKSILGYQRTRDKYTLDLTRSLYYQNLDKNAGVLYRLCDEAEEQEFRETIIGYFLLWRNAPSIGWSDSQLDEQAELRLRELTNIDIDFEVHDSLKKLRRLGIIEPSAEDRWRAMSLETAWDQLNSVWQNRSSFTTDST